MAYLNHAGTSWPKPAPVRAAVADALEAPAASWPERFAADHRAVADALGVADGRRLLLTPGCTSALATAVADLPWRAGDRVLISSCEHHALHRPVTKLAARGVEATVLPRGPEEPLALDALERELDRGRVRLVALTAACNVTGELLPVARAAELARAAGATVLVDAAQTAGWLPLPLGGDAATPGADLVAFAGHKGLQAPWGIGGLHVAPEVELEVPGAVCELPAPQVGAGADAPRCAPMPGYCDVGSVDRAALAGLAAGLGWLAERPERLARARAQVERAARAAEEHGLRVHGARDPDRRLPTVALSHPALPTAELGRALAERGVQVGTGLQCAPLAHAALGTEGGGVLRISIGPATSDEELERALERLGEVVARGTDPAHR